MTNISILIHSLSILFLIGSIATILMLPDKAFTPNLARALFSWFFALGIVPRVENGLISRFEGNVNTPTWNMISVPALIVQVFWVIGILRFFAVLSNQPYAITPNIIIPIVIIK